MPQCQCGPTEGGLDHLVHLVEKQLRAQLDPSRGRRGIGRWERHRVAIDVATVGRVDPATAGIGPPRSPGEVPGPQPPRRVPPWCGRADGSRGRLWRFVFCGARRDRASVPGSPFHSLRAPAAPGAAEGSRRLRACSCCACLGYRSFDRGCPVAHRIRVAACSVAVSAGTSSSASRAPCRPNRCMMPPCPPSPVDAVVFQSNPICASRPRRGASAAITSCSRSSGPRFAATRRRRLIRWRCLARAAPTVVLAASPSPPAARVQRSCRNVVRGVAHGPEQIGDGRCVAPGSRGRHRDARGVDSGARRDDQ